jgi:HNH endonuclease
MLPETLDDILCELNFTSNLAAPYVMLARHASESRNFFDLGVDYFEEYQRFQAARNFAKCRFLVSFLGLPNHGGDATFAGIYEVLGSVTQGDPGFRAAQGYEDVVKLCEGLPYLYSLSRLQQYDSLRTEWDIRWNLPGPAKYQYFKPNLPIPTLRFGTATDFASLKGIVNQGTVLESLIGEVNEDSLYFSEGAAAYTKHLKRERNAALVAFVKNRAKKDGIYRCCVCGFDFFERYGIDYIECHHTIPVSSLKIGDKTDPNDVVLLCANCHRAVHKRKPWLSKVELYKLLQ